LAGQARDRAPAEVGSGQRDAGRLDPGLAWWPERLQNAYSQLDLHFDMEDRRARRLAARDRVVADEPPLAGSDTGGPSDTPLAPCRDVLPVPELGEVACPEHAHRQISHADVAIAELAHDQQEVVAPAERRVAPHEVDDRRALPFGGREQLIAAAGELRTVVGLVP
jgi:hypothetical protein